MLSQRGALTIVSLVLFGAFLAGCGGGNESQGSTQSSAAQSRQAPAPKGEVQSPKSTTPSQTSQVASGKDKGSRANAAPLKVSGGGSAQFEVKGGDNSVQEYGSEAEETELREAAEVVHSFYVARVAEEWARACAFLSKRTVEGFQQLAAQSPKLKGKDCAPLLAALTEPLSRSLQHAATTVDAHALRHEGDQGFLIYTGPPHETVYSIPLNLEGGKWKVGAVSASALPGMGSG